jgi:hypothetical protein
MKQTPELRKAQQEMMPGVISLQGFIGTDKRDLAEILDDDDNTVKSLGLTHAEIAAKMRKFRELGEAGLGEFVRVQPHFEIRVGSVRGGLRCPFGDKGLTRKSNIEVVNLANGKSVTYTDLCIHLIEKHGFYQGKGSPFRLDPRALAETLELTPADQSS